MEPLKALAEQVRVNPSAKASVVIVLNNIADSIEGALTVLNNSVGDGMVKLRELSINLRDSAENIAEAACVETVEPAKKPAHASHARK